MQSFKSFLTEASFGGSGIFRAASLIHSLLEKKLGQNLYRFDGRNGFQDIVVGSSPGKGLLLFTDTNKAYRVNFVGSTVDSISIWNKFTIEGSADFTMNLNGLNIVQIIDQIVPFLKNPRSGDFKIALRESVNLQEARRVSPEEFYRTIASHIPHSNHHAVHLKDIDAAAKHHDLVINQYFRKNKVDKDVFDIVPDSLKGQQSSASDSSSSEPSRTYHISITPQDPITKKFLSPKSDPKVAQITNEIRRTLANPNPTPGDLKDPDSMFSILEDLVELIIHKHINSLIVYGGPGTGKTHTVVELIHKNGLIEDKDWVHFQGAKVTPSALYQLLFLHRNNELIVLDDADSAFQSEDAKNILKGALDTKEERKLSWVSTRTVNVDRMSQQERDQYNAGIEAKLLDDPADTSIKYPSKFVFTSRILFISNLSLKDFDPALLSRSAKIDMTLTEEQTLRRIENNLDRIGDTSVPVDVKREIINSLKDAAGLGRLNNITIRTFVKAIAIYKSGKKNWLDLLDYT